MLTHSQIKTIEDQVTSLNPADLTRQINTIQTALTALARDKTDAMTTRRHLNMASLEPSIRRLQTTKQTASPHAHHT